MVTLQTASLTSAYDDADVVVVVDDVICVPL
jgi:hypothetical protein